MKDFRMWYQYKHGVGPLPMTFSFSASFEYEIDKAIEALKVAKTMLRADVEPIPRSLSLITT